MEQVDIRRLYSILAEYQEMDPVAAEKLLQRILRALKELLQQHDTEKKESISYDEML